MTEKQLFYPLLSVYFSLILGDLQKEKLQIVSIFRFGHKKRGLFQCPPKGREFIPVVFEEVVVHSFPLGKAGMGLVGGCRCRPVGIAVGRHCASCCLRNSRNPRHVAHGDFAERDGHCRYPVDRHPDLRNHHGWLVTYEPWARAY